MAVGGSAMNDWPSSDLKFEEFLHALHMMNHDAHEGKFIQFLAGFAVRGYGNKFGQILRRRGRNWFFLFFLFKIFK